MNVYIKAAALLRYKGRKLSHKKLPTNTTKKQQKPQYSNQRKSFIFFCIIFLLAFIFFFSYLKTTMQKLY